MAKVAAGRGITAGEISKIRAPLAPEWHRVCEIFPIAPITKRHVTRVEDPSIPGSKIHSTGLNSSTTFVNRESTTFTKTHLPSYFSTLRRLAA